MRIEFEKLEQRPGTHTVPVKMTREQLEETALKLSDLITKVEAREEDLKAYTKDAREEINDLYDALAAANRTYRYARDPKTVDGLWGLDFNDHGKVRCKTCVERYDKAAKEGGATGEGVPSYEDSKALSKAHSRKKEPERIGDEHPIVEVWERPLGTKWFVQPDVGEVYGPLSIREKDLQKDLPKPETKAVEPFKLAIDVDQAVPLLDEVERSAAEAKLKETEKQAGLDRTNDDTTNLCPQCGLPLADHPPTIDEDATNGSADPCKAAMLVNAEREQKAQAERTEKKYGADVTLDPNAIYPCAVCHTDTYGKDLQPVTIEGEQRFVCFSCEQGIDKADEKKPPQKKRRRKGGSDEASTGGAPV